MVLAPTDWIMALDQCVKMLSQVETQIIVQQLTAKTKHDRLLRRIDAFDYQAKRCKDEDGINAATALAETARADLSESILVQGFAVDWIFGFKGAIAALEPLQPSLELQGDRTKAENVEPPTEPEQNKSQGVT